MLIGVPKELKNHEYRVGLVPGSVRELLARGHQVLVETNAGAGLNVADREYQAAGATVAAGPDEIYARAELVVKVKEPEAVERKKLRPGQALFAYLHLAPDPAQTQDLIASGASCIAYETVTSPEGRLPLLAPMSEIAGRMAIQVGAHALERPHGGRGVLLAGVPGVAPGKVTILGGGAVGSNAAVIACGIGAEVVIIDRSIEALRRLSAQFGPRLKTVYSTRETIEEHVASSHLVIGAVLIPGAAAPKLVTRAMLASMKQGAVMVDVAIDQGGCFETSRPTTHSEPTFEVDGIVHYCVTNMPGAVARTSAFALNNATLPFVLELAGYGVIEALRRNPHLRNGLNVHRGALTCRAVAESLGLPCIDPLQALGG